MKTLKWILCILTVLSTVFMLTVLPDTVPVHFDISGAPDRWGSKLELLILPVVLIACAFVMDPMAKSYRKKADEVENEKEKAEHLTNAKVLNITSIITMFLFFIMNIVTLYTTYVHAVPDNQLPEIDILRVIGVVMGVVMIVLGNYLPKTRNNPHIGFRFPWTRYNDTTWNKSNRFASYVLMVVGAISAISSILVKKSIVASFLSAGALLIALPVIMIYAYIVYREERKKDDEGIDKE